MNQIKLYNIGDSFKDKSGQILYTLLEFYENMVLFEIRFPFKRKVDYWSEYKFNNLLKSKAIIPINKK